VECDAARSERKRQYEFPKIPDRDRAAAAARNRRLAGRERRRRLTRRWRRMQFCSGCGSVRLEHRLFARIAFDLLSNFSSKQFLHCYIAPHNDLLWHTIKRLLPPFPPRMTCHANFA